MSLYDSMVNAALAGVDVQFMMTGWPDHKSAWNAAKSYFEPLLRAGARIFMYEKGFFHAKTMAVDSQAHRSRHDEPRPALASSCKTR